MSWSRFVNVCASIAGLGLLFTGPLRAAQVGTVESVLASAGQYVQQYATAMSAVVAEEKYQQSLVSASRAQSLVSASLASKPVVRTTRADLMIIESGPAGWVSFRDVYELDGRPVRDREMRLANLLASGAPDTMIWARQMTQESARFNINPLGVIVDRNINAPLTALQFLRAANQRRSAFKLEKPERVGGVETVVLSFAEQTKPRLIGSPDQAAAQGRFWVEAASGAVIRSELRLESTVDGNKGVLLAGQDRMLVTPAVNVASSTTVDYARDTSGVDLWVPRLMSETYEFQPSGDVIRGHAEYSNLRHFKVSTSQ